MQDAPHSPKNFNDVIFCFLLFHYYVLFSTFFFWIQKFLYSIHLDQGGSLQTQLVILDNTSITAAKLLVGVLTCKVNAVDLWVRQSLTLVAAVVEAALTIALLNDVAIFGYGASMCVSKFGEIGEQ